MVFVIVWNVLSAIYAIHLRRIVCQPCIQKYDMSEWWMRSFFPGFLSFWTYVRPIDETLLLWATSLTLNAFSETKVLRQVTQEDECYEQKNKQKR